ncbi:hypothetical protein LXL04_021083 [Taraxacum kok-saghyz]
MVEISAVAGGTKGKKREENRWVVVACSSRLQGVVSSKETKEKRRIGDVQTLAENNSLGEDFFDKSEDDYIQWLNTKPKSCSQMLMSVEFCLNTTPKNEKLSNVLGELQVKACYQHICDLNWSTLPIFDVPRFVLSAGYTDTAKIIDDVCRTWVRVKRRKGDGVVEGKEIESNTNSKMAVFREHTIRHLPGSTNSKRHNPLPQSSSTRPRLVADPLLPPQRLLNQGNRRMRFFERNRNFNGLLSHFAVLFPWTKRFEFVKEYKQAHRREDDIALVNAGILVFLEPWSNETMQYAMGILKQDVICVSQDFSKESIPKSHLSTIDSQSYDTPMPPGGLHAAMILSKKPHARLLSIDDSGARSSLGFVGIFFAKDIPGDNATGPSVEDEQIFASDIVTCVGQELLLQTLMKMQNVMNNSARNKTNRQRKTKNPPIELTVARNDYMK